jgi:Skp family chaperone for outer membrane proteins
MQQGRRLAVQLDRKSKEMKEDMQSTQVEVDNRIGRKLIGLLENYAEKNSYSVVLDSSIQNSPILHASENVELTQEMIRLYERKYPAKLAN